MSKQRLPKRFPSGARSIAPSILFALVAVTGPCSSGKAGPEPNPTGAYEIELSVGGGNFVPATIGSDGEGCERFLGDDDAERTCYIATNLIPTLIGGEAYSELNDRRTPALDAIAWRARANADPNVCAAGGLTGPFLGECQRDAVSDDYEYTTGSMRVRVPIGGAHPSPLPGET